MAHLQPTPQSWRAFVERGFDGPLVMLNLLRFREQADYSDSPELAPPTPISGAEAYERYIAAARPLVEAVGGELVFVGAGGAQLIGPSEERWDLALLVRHRSVEVFASMTSNEDYLAILGHRSAAVEDSRLLPLLERASAP